MAERDDGFLTRWARRKEQARSGVEPPDGTTAAVPAEPAGTETGKTPAEQAEEQAKLVDSLPDIDSMTRESDFSVFMQKGVPQALRNRALRKLWRLDPVFANLDGLNDYDEDYTAIGKGLGKAVNTLYQVGKGMRGREPAPETAQEEQATESLEQTAGAETADDGPDTTPTKPDQEAVTSSRSAEAAPDRPMEHQSDDVATAAPVPLEEETPIGETAREASKVGRAAARRWGRFTS